MKMSMVFAFAIIFTRTLYSQNLVPNPSFENISSCPHWKGLIQNALNWNSPDDHFGTPDLMHECSVFLYNTVPSNTNGFEFANTGEAFAAIILLDLNSFLWKNGVEWREYIQTPLTYSMKREEEYKVSFYYSLADSSDYVIEELGFLFTVDKIYGANSSKAISNKNVQGFTLNPDSKKGWRKGIFKYKAGGGEKFLTIGNFRSNDSTRVIQLNNPDYPVVFLFIDDISVSICEEKNINLGNDTSVCSIDSLLLDINITDAGLKWSNNNTSSHQWIKDKGKYWVEVSDVCGLFSDTIQIDFEECEHAFYVPSAFTPNNDRTNDTFEPKGPRIAGYKMKIYNRWGDMIYESFKEPWTGIYSPNGVYFYILEITDLSGKSYLEMGKVNLFR